MTARKPFNHFITLVVLISLCSALVFFGHSKVHAQGGNPSVDKVSPDLRQLIQSGQGNTTVKLIVQSNSPVGLLGSLLQTKGLQDDQHSQQRSGNFPCFHRGFD